MNELMLYLLKVSLGIVVFYAVYWVTLRKETLFNANRLFLISSLILSLILPFVGFRYNVYVSNSDTGNVFVELNKNLHSISAITTSNSGSTERLNWQSALLFIYLTGLTIFFLRLIWQSLELAILIVKNRIIKMEGISVIENCKYGLPFSFFNIVFINPNFHTGTDLTNILAHEKVHIRENHWFDLLIVEIFTIVFWFNPFVWLFERSIKQNHEYLADEGVLAQGFSIGRYQAILINQIMGMQIIGMTNNLNYSLNKKRINMMTKMKTPKRRVYKILWALPATALLLLAFAKPAYMMSTESTPKQPVHQNNVEQTIQFKGKVVDGTGTPLSGASIVVYGGTTGTTSDKDGLFTLKLGKTDEICISYVGYTTQIISRSQIEYNLQKNPNMPVTITLVIGVIKLDIDEIIKNGKPKDEISEKNNIKKDDEVFVAVEELPEYPGGLYALAEEIKEKTSKLDYSGKIEVGFTVEKSGNIKVFQTIMGGKVSDEFAKQLIYKIYSLKTWTPGKQRGNAVSVNYSITLHF
jgi:hypothetical protein